MSQPQSTGEGTVGTLQEHIFQVPTKRSTLTGSQMVGSPLSPHTCVCS